MMDTSEWCYKVVEELKKNGTLLSEVISTQTSGSGKSPPPRDESELLLQWLRGDEPLEMYNFGDSPEAYAQFLVDEWRIFGPEGE